MAQEAAAAPPPRTFEPGWADCTSQAHGPGLRGAGALHPAGRPPRQRALQACEERPSGACSAGPRQQLCSLPRRGVLSPAPFLRTPFTSSPGPDTPRWAQVSWELGLSRPPEEGPVPLGFWAQGGVWPVRGQGRRCSDSGSGDAWGAALRLLAQSRTRQPPAGLHPSPGPRVAAWSPRWLLALLTPPCSPQLAGGVILGVALWLRHDPKTTNLLYLELGDRPAPSTFYVGIYILIAVGAVMMFVGFLGCYGAIQESQCLLATFFACLVILFACEVAAGIWGFVNKDQVSPASAVRPSIPNSFGTTEPLRGAERKPERMREDCISRQAVGAEA
ncbi:PREDICTED: CD81 antigen [Condylura cristata]|uniref:CD81 antigen n=1 Tax=Condylura cristata TaxID=143302 RepID=UPI000643D4DC|nr:PREDICTED: CD81 antigen [Condylura cristata]